MKTQICERNETTLKLISQFKSFSHLWWSRKSSFCSLSAYSKESRSTQGNAQPGTSLSIWAEAVFQHRMRHHKSVTKLRIHNALRKLVVDLQLHQTRMLSQERSHVSFSQFFKTWKDPLYTRHLKQQAPWRRKGKENICNSEANSGVNLPVALATPFVTNGKRQHWKKQILPP